MNDSKETLYSFSKPGQRVQWPYNRWFNAHLKKRTRYTFVRQYWDREISDLAKQQYLKLEPHDPVAVRLDDRNRTTLHLIDQAGNNTLMQFLEQVSSQEKAETLCVETQIEPGDLLILLEKIYRYLPFGAQMRQLVEREDTSNQKCVDILVKHKLGFSLALLEEGRTQPGRLQLEQKTSIPGDALMDLIRRADLTRLHLMSGGSVRMSWALGYKGLIALQKANPETYYADSVTYFNVKGNGVPFDFTLKAVSSHLLRMRQAITLIEE